MGESGKDGAGGEGTGDVIGFGPVGGVGLMPPLSTSKVAREDLKLDASHLGRLDAVPKEVAFSPQGPVTPFALS